MSNNTNLPKNSIHVEIDDVINGFKITITGDSDFMCNDVVNKPKNQIRLLKQIVKEMKLSDYNN